MVTVDGTPLEEFAALGKKMNAAFKGAVKKSEFNGCVASRIDVRKKDGNLEACVWSSRPGDSEMTADIFDNIKDSPSFIRDIHERGILCRYNVPFTVEDRDDNVEWSGVPDQMTMGENVFTIVSAYTAKSRADFCADDDEAYSLCDVLTPVQVEKAKTGLAEDLPDPAPKEFSNEFSVKFFWNERNWYTEYSIIVSDGKTCSVYHFNDPEEKAETETWDPVFLKDVVKGNYHLIVEGGSLRGMISDINRCFEEFRGRGVSMRGYSDVFGTIEKFCRIVCE